MDMKRLKKQMDFILEIDKEKNIKRQTLITDASRQETDAEHAWHLAVMCALLSEYSNEKIDVAHTMLMVLMHDLVMRVIPMLTTRRRIRARRSGS